MKKSFFSIAFLMLSFSLFAQQWNGSATNTGLLYRDGNVVIGATAVTGSWATGERLLQVKGVNAALGLYSNTYSGSMLFGFFPQYNYTGIFSDQYPLAFFVGGTERLRFLTTGATTIGSVPTTPAGYKLYVEQGILTEKVKVAIKTSADWSDHVFAPGYKLRPLSEVRSFISKNGHLPGVPSANDMVRSGLDVAASDAKLLEKIEELTLYILQVNERLEKLEKENAALKATVQPHKQ
jgi:hypothetical protein